MDIKRMKHQKAGLMHKIENERRGWQQEASRRQKEITALRRRAEREHAKHMARGIDIPTHAPNREIDAAMFPRLINSNSFIGVIKV